MRTAVKRTASTIVQSRRGLILLQQFPQAQSLSFSTESTAREGPKFNILFFCPRSDDHLRKFNDEYPQFIREVRPHSVSVTDVAHMPENNNKAISALISGGVTPSSIMPHIVLIGHDKEGADRRIRYFRDSGIESIFVVRGNPLTVGQDKSYTHHPQGYEDMGQLMSRIKELAPDMEIAVAGYPEYDEGFEQGLDELKSKVDCGADRIITQHFFQTQHFLRFLDGCEKRGIDVPVMPTVLPIGNPKYLLSISKSTEVDIPAKVVEILLKQGSTVDFDALNPDVEARAVEYTARQIQGLVDLRLPQVCGINTYAANNIDFLGKVLSSVGVVKEDRENKVRNSSQGFYNI
jgi:methylenetetrahydrofolate reductase (NADPH)